MKMSKKRGRDPNAMQVEDSQFQIGWREHFALKELDSLRDKEKHLRNELDRLRDEKKQLREEKKQLRDKEEQLYDRLDRGKVSDAEYKALRESLDRNLARVEKNIEDLETKIHEVEEDNKKEIKEIKRKIEEIEDEIKEVKTRVEEAMKDPMTSIRGTGDAYRAMEKDLKELLEADFVTIPDPTGSGGTYKTLNWRWTESEPHTYKVLYCRDEIWSTINFLKREMKNGESIFLITGMQGSGKTTSAPVILKELRRYNPRKPESNEPNDCMFQRGASWIWIPKGFPKERITVLYNKTDAVKFMAANYRGLCYNFIDPQGNNDILDLSEGFKHLISIGFVSSKRASLLSHEKYRDTHDYFGKKASKRKVTKVWEPSEVVDCNEKSYGLEQDELTRRMEDWGPSLRYIFKRSDEKVDDIISNKIKREHLKSFFLDSKPNIDVLSSGKVVHMVPYEDDCSRFYFRFSSAAVKAKLMEKYMDFVVQVAKDRVFRAAKGSFSANAAADWLEMLTIQHIMKGQGFFSPTRKLGSWDGKEGMDIKVDFAEIKEHEFYCLRSYEDCEFEAKVLYEPSWRSNESIDCFFVWNEVLILIQISFAPSHPIRYPGIKRVWTAAQKVHENSLKGYALIFVTPSGNTRNGVDIVAQYKRQAYQNSRGTVVKPETWKKSHPELLMELGQYIYALPGDFEFPK